MDVKEALEMKTNAKSPSGELRMPEGPEWCATPSGSRVQAALAYAQMAGDITLIHGGAGLGKTRACTRYAKVAPKVWLVTMTPATGSVGACLERIGQALGLTASGRVARLEMAIMERLSGTGGLLIVDEAQHLGVRSLEALRSLHDATGVALALVGNDRVHARMTGRGARSATFAQLFSRIGKRVRLSRATREDVSAICTGWKIREKTAVNFAETIASRPGAIRGLTKTLRLAGLLAAGEGRPLSLSHMKSAWRDLSGGQA